MTSTSLDLADSTRGDIMGVFYQGRDMPYWVYIMASKRNGTLYTGVTNDLGRRLEQHRTGRGSEFVERYGVKTLVWAEAHGDVVEAIATEKRIKHWHRRWKLELIEKSNPDWLDISSDIH